MKGNVETAKGDDQEVAVTVMTTNLTRKEEKVKGCYYDSINEYSCASDAAAIPPPSVLASQPSGRQNEEKTSNVYYFHMHEV